jgi:hypothetical protein
MTDGRHYTYLHKFLTSITQIRRELYAPTALLPDKKLKYPLDTRLGALQFHLVEENMTVLGIEEH